MIVLIDHSGSMSGPKWEAADWAVQNLLAGLGANDTFNLGLFHSTTRWFARQPVRGDDRTIRQATEFLLQHKDSGGTELGVALEQALSQPRDTADRARHVVIVTDAQVSDAGRIMALVEREAEPIGPPARRRPLHRRRAEQRPGQRAGGARRRDGPIPDQRPGRERHRVAPLTRCWPTGPRRSCAT